jgi:hypothetical protein
MGRPRTRWFSQVLQEKKELARNGEAKIVGRKEIAEFSSIDPHKTKMLPEEQK